MRSVLNLLLLIWHTPSLWEGRGGFGVSSPSEEVRAASMAARRFVMPPLPSELELRAVIILVRRIWWAGCTQPRTARGHRGRALMNRLIDLPQALP